MSFLGDAFDFEKFHLGDLWERIKKSPEQLILGVDPLSTSIWNKLGVTDNEPWVNQLGGPMGSGYLGLGSGGVYDRAAADGVNTGPANSLHNVAETVASIWGGAGAIGGLGNIGGGAAAAGGGGGGGGGGAAAGGGGGGGGFGMGEGFWGNLAPEDYMMLFAQMQGGQGQQQQPGMPGMRPTPSSFRMPQAPATSQAQTPYSPGRQLPFGLLAQDEEEKLRNLIGGLLS